MSEEPTRLDRILRALSHPIRRRILRSLADHPGSASSMAREFETELSVVSYHLNHVLARDCDAVELVEMIPRRGSVEKIYRLNSELWSDQPAGGEAGQTDGALRALSPGECFLEAVEAMDTETFVELDGSAWEWFRVTLGSRPWKEIQAAKREFNKAVEAAVREGEERGDPRRGRTHAVIVGVAAFPAARPGEGS